MNSIINLPIRLNHLFYKKSFPIFTYQIQTINKKNSIIFCDSNKSRHYRNEISKFNYRRIYEWIYEKDWVMIEKTTLVTLYYMTPFLNLFSLSFIQIHETSFKIQPWPGRSRINFYSFDKFMKITFFLFLSIF